MRRTGSMAVLLALGLGIGSPAAQAEDRALSELPKDVWNLAFVWTEPLKGVVRETRRFDPVSGLWIGLVEGSVKSVERTTDFFLPKHEDTRSPVKLKSGKALLRYSF